MFSLTIPIAGIFVASSLSANSTCGVSPVLAPVKYTASPLFSVLPVLLYTSIVTAPFKSPSKKPEVLMFAVASNPFASM